MRRQSEPHKASDNTKVEAAKDAGEAEGTAENIKAASSLPLKNTPATST